MRLWGIAFKTLDSRKIGLVKKVEILIVNALDKEVPEDAVESAIRENETAEVFRIHLPLNADDLDDLFGVHVVVREVAEA